MSKIATKKQAEAVPSLKDMVEARLEADERIAAIEAELKPLKEAKQAINAKIIEEFKRRQEFSSRIEGATVSLSVRKTVAVVKESQVIEQLKAMGLTQYIAESLNELFEEPKKRMATGEDKLLEGMEIRETEFVSIRKSAKEDARQMTAGEFKQITK